MTALPVLPVLIIVAAFYGIEAKHYSSVVSLFLYNKTMEVSAIPTSSLWMGKLKPIDPK